MRPNKHLINTHFNEFMTRGKRHKWQARKQHKHTLLFRCLGAKESDSFRCLGAKESDSFSGPEVLDIQRQEVLLP